MSGWIKYEKDLETDPRFLRMLRKVCHARVTQASHDDVTTAEYVTLLCGALARFWSYADTHLRADDRLDLGPSDIDALVGVPNFCVAMPEDWLVIVDDDTVELPDYQRHNGVEARKRDLAQKRQETKRRRDANTPVTVVRDEGVTAVLPDQTRPDQTKTKPKKGAGRAAPLAVADLHESLPRSEWDEWLEHRRAKHWPMDGTTLRKQLKALAPFPTEIQRQMIDTAINAGWQGIFPPKGRNGPAPTHRPKGKTADEAEAEARAKGEDIWAIQK